MTQVFQRLINHTLPEAVKGDGIYLIDADGKRYMNASGGAAVSCLGHSDPDVIKAIKDQIDNLADLIAVGKIHTLTAFDYLQKQIP